jgi:protein-S-isoprenylcysteine O-methyltransferase Ste14
MTLVRHLVAILLLPFVVTVIVPGWLMEARWALPAELPATTAVARATHVAGGALLVAGALLFAWCVLLFARVGRGTLAPWDPTTALVAVGPYRWVRNPMITGVSAVLAGQALIHRSPRLLAWLGLFVLINHAYFLLVEEPGLERRFGDAYVRYRRSVPRWLPRWRARERDDAEVERR